MRRTGLFRALQLTLHFAYSWRERRARSADLSRGHVGQLQTAYVARGRRTFWARHATRQLLHSRC